MYGVSKMEWIKKGEAAGYPLCLEVRRQGKDLAAMLYGGEKPHIGSVCISVPRESLTGDGSVSCTTSVVNLPGHKDEQIGRMVSEALCKKYGAVTVCSCGFHIDHADKKQIKQVIEGVEQLLVEI